MGSVRATFQNWKYANNVYEYKMTLLSLNINIEKFIID